MMYYKYGNIVRVLIHSIDDFPKSKMIDVDMNEGTILSVFDANNKFDASFIQSFINIILESRSGFTITEDSDIQHKAMSYIQKQ